MNYKVIKPIRIVEKDADEFLITLPSVRKQMIVNANVISFINYLSDLDYVNEQCVYQYVTQNDIINCEDYRELFSMLVQSSFLAPL
ncbi:hypothetical protein SDC9_143586 [bioreactor metagenome]|uniref:Uncharacterized protein n=1 Tax=bioreactor metagenome TaxID=1076179 RepID=A0A645E6I6_9ZZZZ